MVHSIDSLYRVSLSRPLVHVLAGDCNGFCIYCRHAHAVFMHVMGIPLHAYTESEVDDSY